MGQICLSFAASCVDTDIEFSSLIAPDLPSLTADRLKLHEAILNLLRNAREAISSAGSIRLEAVLKDQMLQITISDTGCGISPEYLDTIFDPFVTYKPNGTGLGLPIARGIIEAHHGSIAFLFPEETSDSKNTPDNPDKSGTLLNHMSGSHLRIVLPLC